MWRGLQVSEFYDHWHWWKTRYNLLQDGQYKLNTSPWYSHVRPLSHRPREWSLTAWQPPVARGKCAFKWLLAVARWHWLQRDCRLPAAVCTEDANLSANTQQLLTEWKWNWRVWLKNQKQRPMIQSRVALKACVTEASFMSSTTLATGSESACGYEIINRMLVKRNCTHRPLKL